MPHITIKIHPGQTEEQKQGLTQAITAKIVEITGKPERVVSIDFIEVAEATWMEEVYDSDIKPNLNRLYKKPGY